MGILLPVNVVMRRASGRSGFERNEKAYDDEQSAGSGHGRLGRFGRLF